MSDRRKYFIPAIVFVIVAIRIFGCEQPYQYQYPYRLVFPLENDITTKLLPYYTHSVEIGRDDCAIVVSRDGVTAGECTLKFDAKKVQEGAGNRYEVLISSRKPVEMFVIRALDADGDEIGRSESITPLDVQPGTPASEQLVFVPVKAYMPDMDPGLQKIIACDLMLEFNVHSYMGGGELKRWKSDRIPIYSELRKETEDAARAWEEALNKELKFEFSDTPVEHGINVVFGDPKDVNGNPGCGENKNFENFEKTTILIPENPGADCPETRPVLKHELGHSLGFMGHPVNRGGIMDRNDEYWRDSKGIDLETARVFQIIYSHNPGEKLTAEKCFEAE